MKGDYALYKMPGFGAASLVLGDATEAKPMCMGKAKKSTKGPVFTAKAEGQCCG